jgi:citrate synthase
MDSNGLEGVVVANTELSDVDGERGRLVIRGHDVEELALHHDFESVCGLLWTGVLPDDAAHAALRAALGRARVRAFARLPSLGDALDAADAMDALRASLAHLRADDIAPVELKVELTAAVAVFAAAWSRRREGKAALAPDPGLSHAADYLRMAGTAGADAARARGLNAYLVAASDHGMNASTFTARVVASTHSDAVSAVVAAIGALKGPLHGGAPGRCWRCSMRSARPSTPMHGSPRELAAGRRIMGMGHRVYRVRDPRAAVLERAIEQLHAAGLHSNRLALARAVEAVAVASLGERNPQRRLAANVEFYTAVILDAVGLPQALFSATFAVARVAGWLAHVDDSSPAVRSPAASLRGPRARVCEPA